MKNLNELKYDVERRLYTKKMERKTFIESAEWILCLAIDDIKRKHH